MRSIFICHNLITVYKVMAFIEQFQIKKPMILYYDKSIELPLFVVLAIKNKYDFNLCHYENRSDNSPHRFIYWKKAFNSIKTIIMNEANNNSAVDLYVFLDHWDIMPSILHFFAKHVKNRGRIALLEEGLGLYSPFTKLNESYLAIKKMIFICLNMSYYCLLTNTIGAHPLIDTVFCSNPEKLKKIDKIRGKRIEFEGDLINYKNSISFLSLFVGDIEKLKQDFKDCMYVFLTQPMTGILHETELKMLITNVFECLGRNASVLIKKHPRDSMDYSFLKTFNIILCEEKYNVLPFECFYPLVDNARIITFLSSVCNNITPKKKSVFMYRLLNNNNYTYLCDNTFFDKRKIVIINSINELKQVLEYDTNMN